MTNEFSHDGTDRNVLRDLIYEGLASGEAIPVSKSMFDSIRARVIKKPEEKSVAP